MHTPGRGDGALRRFRVALPETSYFLTFCTAGRAHGLTAVALATALRGEVSAIEADGHWVLRAGVFMPNHLHLLVRVVGRLPIARCVARFKTKTRSALLAHELGWQPNFYEHRLRPDDRVEDVVGYIFLNPYHGGVVSPGAAYPWFWLGVEEDVWFSPGTDHGRPFPEWLR
jgi:REP element-mobilizing transposase RayT